MKYKILWVDATLYENWKAMKDFYNSLGVELTIENNEGKRGWIDYGACKKFKAKNDKQAINITRSLLDIDSRIDVFSLLKDKKVIFTEEQL